MTVFSNRDCWRQAASEREILQYQKRGIAVTHKIYFATDPGLDERHFITIGSDLGLLRDSAAAQVKALKGV